MHQGDAALLTPASTTSGYSPYGAATIGSSSTLSGNLGYVGHGADNYNSSADTLSVVNSVGVDGSSDGPVKAQIDDANGTLTGSNNIFTTSTGVPAGLIASTADPLLISPTNASSSRLPILILGAGSYGLGNGLAAAAATTATDERGYARTVAGLVDIGATQTPFAVTGGSIAGPLVTHVGSSLAIQGSTQLSGDPVVLTAVTIWTITGVG